VAENRERLRAADLIKEIKRAGIRYIVALPDRTTCEHVLKPLMKDPELRVIQICKEDEGVSICSGLYAAGQRALLLMQYTGLMDSVNALRGIAVEGKNPVCMMVGLLNKEPGVSPTQSKHYGLRVVEPVLDPSDVGSFVNVANIPLLVEIWLCGSRIHDRECLDQQS